MVEFDHFKTKNMKQYDVKISGSGTIEEIKLALDNLIAELILDLDMDNYYDENATLLIEIEELDPEEIED